MGVYRTDYLMWGLRVDPAYVSKNYAQFEREMDGAENRRFDLVYDGMGGQYAVAGMIVRKGNEYEGFGGAVEIPHCPHPAEPFAAFLAAFFPDATLHSDMRLYAITHLH